MRFVPFVVATFLLLIPALAEAAGSAVITRVGAYEASDHEWIDVQNTGDAPIDLTGWKFWEDNVNHGLSAFRDGLVLAPGETAVVADVAATYVTDHPEWTGIVIDSSWSSLSLEGEPIGLRDPSGALTEFPDAAWLAEAPDAASPTPTSTPPSTAPPSPVGARPANPGELMLSEFLPAPESGSEWIELHNRAMEPLALEGLELHDAVGKIAALSGTLNPGAFLVVTLNSSKLNNGGDTLLLLSGSTVLDQVRYGDDALPAPASGVALAKDANGWLPTTTPTPGAANVISAPSVPAAKKETAVGPDLKLEAGSVLINEVAPRQANGDDWLELANRTARRLDLADWQILVGADAVIPLSGHVSAGSRMLVRLAGDALPEDGILFLVAPGDQTIDQVSYGRYEDGNASNNAPAPGIDASVARHEGQDTDRDIEDFYLPRRPTPAKANVAPEDESEPLVASTRKVVLPACVLPEEPETMETTSNARPAKTTVSAVKKTTTTKKKTISKAAADPPENATLATIIDLPEKTRVRVAGTVVGAPPQSSGRIWFVADGEAGAKLQLSGKPIALSPGDRIRLVATTDWTSGPLLRGASSAVERMGSAPTTTPVERALTDLTSDDGHRLVSVRGEAVSRRGDALTIEDGYGRLSVTLPHGMVAQPGDTVAASGMYLVGDPGRLLVLSDADVSVSRLPAAVPGRPDAAHASSRDSPWPLVGAAAVLGGGALLLLKRRRDAGAAATERAFLLDHS